MHLTLDIKYRENLNEGERRADGGRVAPSGGRSRVLQTENDPSNRHKHLFLLLLVEVALIIEVAEEDDEHDAVPEHRRVHGVGEVALGEQVVAGVHEEQKKLHLEKSFGEKFRSVRVTKKTSSRPRLTFFFFCKSRSPAAER